MNFGKMIIPSIIGGLIIGVLGALPVINVCNYCCTFPILGGLIAAIIYGKTSRVDADSGAIVGAIAGMIGGLISSIGGIVINIVLTMLKLAAPIPGLSDTLASYIPISNYIAVSLILLIVYVIQGVVFGAIGGIIGGFIGHKKPKTKVVPVKPVTPQVPPIPPRPAQ